MQCCQARDQRVRAEAGFHFDTIQTSNSRGRAWGEPCNALGTQVIVLRQQHDVVTNKGCNYAAYSGCAWPTADS
jgi:hypothetical protein